MALRRPLLLALGAWIVSPRGRAQPTVKPVRIGVLALVVPPGRFASLRRNLRELGWEEGQDVSFEFSSGEGDPGRLAELAAGLVRRKVDLIVATANPEIVAAKAATSTIPIVMVGGSAPVESGLVGSLARPGGNVTGTVVHSPETAGKVFQLLKETLPTVRRVALLMDPDYPGTVLYVRQAERASVSMDIELIHADPVDAQGRQPGSEMATGRYRRPAGAWAHLTHSRCQ